MDTTTATAPTEPLSEPANDATDTAEPREAAEPSRWEMMIAQLADGYAAQRAEQGRPLDDVDLPLVRDVFEMAVQASIAVHTEIARGGHPLFDLIDGLTDTIAEQRVRIIELKGEAERVRVEGA